MKFRFRLLLVAFALSFLLVSILSAVSVSRFSRLRNRVDSVERSYGIANMINRLDRQVRELDNEAFRYLVSGDSSFFQSYERSAEHIKRISDSLKALTSDNTTQQSLMVLFESDLALYHLASRQAMKARLMPDSVLAPALDRDGSRILQTAEGRLARMTDVQGRILKARTTERENYQQHTWAMIRALSIVFGVLTLLLFFLLIHEFRKRMLYQAELQQKMLEIAQSRQELEHIAYAASHDLQEPLRKIRILTDKWQHQQKNNAVADDTSDTLNRIVAAATRMQELVAELMTLTTLNEGQRPLPCPLSNYAHQALESLKAQVTAKDARVRIEDLPLVQGHPDQLHLLFKNLLDNALKFTRPGATPVISITAGKAGSSELGQDMDTDQQYHCITIRDDGVGFDTKLADKMFGIFRQLHTAGDGYTGKGTGLAICQRIMSNHKGHIIAHGFPNAGATFKLYFPASD